MVRTFIDLVVADLIEACFQVALEICELGDLGTRAKGLFGGWFVIFLDRTDRVLWSEGTGTTESFVIVGFCVHNEHREFAARMIDDKETGSEMTRVSLEASDWTHVRCHPPLIKR